MARKKSMDLETENECLMRQLAKQAARMGSPALAAAKTAHEINEAVGDVRK